MRRSLDPRLAAGLAVLVLGGTLAAILAFGQLRYPAFPSLREHPDPSITGTIAWIANDEEDYRACLWVARASGEEAPRRLACASDLGGPVTWRDGLIEMETPAGKRVYDPADGRVVSQGAPSDPEPPGPPRHGPGPIPVAEHQDRAVSPHGDRAVPVSEDGRVRLYLERDGGSRTLVAEVRGPRHYGWWDVAWSPDGRYLVVHDSAQRLLIVDARDGAVRLLARPAGQATWGP